MVACLIDGALSCALCLPARNSLCRQCRGDTSKRHSNPHHAPFIAKCTCISTPNPQAGFLGFRQGRDSRRRGHHEPERVRPLRPLRPPPPPPRHRQVTVKDGFFTAERRIAAVLITRTQRFWRAMLWQHAVHCKSASVAGPATTEGCPGAFCNPCATLPPPFIPNHDLPGGIAMLREW